MLHHQSGHDHLFERNHERYICTHRADSPNRAARGNPHSDANVRIDPLATPSAYKYVALSTHGAILVSHSPSAGSQEYVGDDRNDDVFISVNGELVRRPDAKVSVFDSGFVLGDGVWEGLRLHERPHRLPRPAFRPAVGRREDAADRHRPDARRELKARLFEVIDANGMRDGVHIRLMVTRGVKRSPYQDPRLTIGKATIVIIPEWKLPRPEMLAKGLDLFTVHIRRTGPAEQDQKLNSHSKLNCILACIQAMEAGADEALMLDDRGFVATCNSTHFFIVRKGELWTSGRRLRLGRHHPRRRACAPRGAPGIPAYEKDFSLFDVYGADEAFCTGTFAGPHPGARRSTAARSANTRATPPTPPGR